MTMMSQPVYIVAVPDLSEANGIMAFRDMTEHAQPVAIKTNKGNTEFLTLKLGEAFYLELTDMTETQTLTCPENDLSPVLQTLFHLSEQHNRALAILTHMTDGYLTFKFVIPKCVIHYI